MPTPRNRRHIIVTKNPSVEAYSPPFRPFRALVPAPASRLAHGVALRTALQQAEIVARQRRAEAGVVVHGAVPGVYIQFDSQPDIDLNLATLENKKKGIELVAVSDTFTDPDRKRVQRATVFVPDGKIGHFISRFEKYAATTPKIKGERRYEDMLDRIAELRLATLRALWTDDQDAYPMANQTIWWELWLRKHDGKELERLHDFAVCVGLKIGARRLEFDDRIVLLVRGTSPQLSSSVDVLNDIAELRRAKETAGFFVDQSPLEQANWVDNLRRRTTPPGDDAPVVCVLDTGINREHPLLVDSIQEMDATTVELSWGAHDHDGHGTEMAGLALHGDLSGVLASASQVRLRHALESVKILPPPSQPPNAPELYGAVTAAAASRAEIQAPERRRCFSMAITSEDKRDRGQPTSWSAAVDALASGRSFDSAKQGLVYLDDDSDPSRRLFVLSAGNVSSLDIDHLNRSDVEPIHDPAQAWNALTVGAYTDRVILNDPRWESWSPLANGGELSPWSTTSVGFATPWPVKPDIVAEGGNIVRNGIGEIDFPVPDLCLLSTYYKPTDKSLVLSWATSAACAQVAHMCGIISAEYPNLWPEAIRALVVHSAEWTSAMKAHLVSADGKRARARLARRYGFGVPSLERALRSGRDALALVIQGSIRPFKDGKMREMHLYELPWPKAVLSGLGEVPVRMRVTLSYFIEPNPARRGWQKRHRYQSHGLRFEVRRPTDSMDVFRKRMNQRALDEEEERPTSAPDERWFLGEQARNRGSIHSDVWVGMAADLAECGVIGIYPVSGWWKEQKNRDRSDNGARYALVVSIETSGVETDIWTPVAQEIGVPIEVAEIET